MNKEIPGKITVTMVAGVLTVFMIGCGSTPVTSVPTPQVSVAATATPGAEENLALDDSNPYDVEDEYLTGAPTTTKAPEKQEEPENIPLDEDNPDAATPSLKPQVATQVPEVTQAATQVEPVEPEAQVTPVAPETTPEPTPMPTPMPTPTPEVTKAPEEVTKVEEEKPEDHRVVVATAVPTSTATATPAAKITDKPKATEAAKTTSTPVPSKQAEITKTPTKAPSAPEPTKKPASSGSGSKTDKLKSGQKTGETITNSNGDVIEVIHHVAGDEFNATEDGLEKDATYRTVDYKNCLFEYVCKGKYSGKYEKSIFYIGKDGHRYSLKKDGYKLVEITIADSCTPYEVQVAVSDGSLREIYGDEIPGGFY